MQNQAASSAPPPTQRTASAMDGFFATIVTLIKFLWSTLSFLFSIYAIILLFTLQARVGRIEKSLGIESGSGAGLSGMMGGESREAGNQEQSNPVQNVINQFGGGSESSQLAGSTEQFTGFGGIFVPEGWSGVIESSGDLVVRSADGQNSVTILRSLLRQQPSTVYALSSDAALAQKTTDFSSIGNVVFEVLTGDAKPLKHPQTALQIVSFYGAGNLADANEVLIVAPNQISLQTANGEQVQHTVLLEVARATGYAIATTEIQTIIQSVKL